MPVADRKYRLDIFLSPLLALALFLFILNDYFLKSAYPNWLTGKLSDFSGLFLFSLFWFAFFPKKTIQVVVFTILFFSFWKSAFSQSAIDLWNSTTGLYVGRTVDYSDLLSLAVLPFARKHFLAFKQWPIKEAFAMPMLILSLFAITGTSMLPKNYNVSFEMQKAQIDMNEIPELAYPWSMGYRDVDFMAVNNIVRSVAEKHGLKCQNCDSQDIGRWYGGYSSISINTNYNFSEKKIFIAVSGSVPRAERSSVQAEEQIIIKVDDIKRDLLDDLEPHYINSTIITKTYAFETEPTDHKFRTIYVSADDIEYSVFQSRYSIGRDDEKFTIIEQIVHGFMKVYPHEDAWEYGCRNTDPPCRFYTFGEATGPHKHMKSNSISVTGTHGFLGRKTKLKIDISQSLKGGVLYLDSATEKLANVLREKLPSDTHIEISPLTEMRSQPILF